MTELEAAALKLHHLFPSRCVVGACCQSGCPEAPALTATGTELGGREALPILKPCPEPGPVAFLLLTQAAPREAALTRVHAHTAL